MALNIPNGTRYGRLTVLGEGEKLILPSGQTNRTLKCICDCGSIKDIRIMHLTRGKISSCGCIIRTMNGESNTDIGTLYRSIKWRTSKKYTESHLYYDKGIKVCSEWLNSYELFKKFCLENGYKKGLQIDRIDNSKGYSPDNCRFVTNVVNVNNRNNTFCVYYKGQKHSLQLLLRKLNYPNKYGTVRSRILRGWEIEEAIFEKPVKGCKRISFYKHRPLNGIKTS